MRIEANLAAWLKLTLIPGLGNEGLRRLLQVFGSPGAILETPTSELGQHVRPAVARSIADGIEESALDAVSAWLEDPWNHIVTLGDAEFPQSLLNITDPPLVLYVKGRMDLLNVRSLAIVGSRNASAQGLRNAEAFALSAADSGLCIVSGMAHGIDAAAHRGGLEGRASSIAVLGTGLDRIYPSANQELAHQLARRGALVSEFPLGTPPLAANFPRRNRIISGLSEGCLVVEASLRSGSLITARMVLEQGREVFAVPGSIHSPQAKGCHQLIKQGAKLVESADDILEELGMSSHPRESDVEAKHPLLSQLGFDPVDVETLASRSNLTIGELSAILLQLELDGAVASLPGGLYQRIA